MHEHMVTDIATTLRALFDPRLLAVVQRCATLAKQHKAALYIVGGTLRDILLGRFASDLDLVIEGDAVAVAQAVAAELGVDVEQHAAFGVAILHIQLAPDEEPIILDLAMARAEHYPQPAALPVVRPATLAEDLRRRDFTINTLAIQVLPDGFGPLIDWCGGLADLRQRTLRVLHDQSFIDDPTRIFRAVRLAVRLAFQFEPATQALIIAAIQAGMIERTTAQRIGNELWLACSEPAPEQVFAELDRIGVLQRIHPELAWEDATEPRLAALRATQPTPEGWRIGVAGIIAFALSTAALTAWLHYLQPPTEVRRMFSDLVWLREQLASLALDAAPSRVDLTLQPFQGAALELVGLCLPERAAQIMHYLQVLRPFRTALDGRFLRELGVPAGPQYALLLAQLRAARLDGFLQSRVDEEAWLRTQVAELLP
jgi:tRNA nucleotidyltransferase (CCA-adding enzyme)